MVPRPVPAAWPLANAPAPSSSRPQSSPCGRDGRCAKRHATPYPTFGTIERHRPAVRPARPAATRTIEKLAEGFDWSEGPVWDRKRRLPPLLRRAENTVFQWKEGERRRASSSSRAATPAATPAGGEPGSNGLVIDPEGRLVLCQHGDRRVARLDDDGKSFTTLADNYEGKRFNSPNDAVYHVRTATSTSPTRPTACSARTTTRPRSCPSTASTASSKDGELTLLTKEMTYPNGIALSPDEKTLYVANSDPEKAIWMAFPVKDDGTLGEGRVFFDATPLGQDARRGCPTA